MANPDDRNLVSLVAAEHVGSDGDGENIQAKRVANYVWNSGTGEWERATPASGGGGGGLTDAELRATPVDVDTGLTDLATETKQDDIITAIEAIPGGGGTPNVISTLNSTDTPLGVDGVFTGTAEDVTDYNFAQVSFFSDVSTASLVAQQSSDGTNWDIVMPVATLGFSATAYYREVPILAKFFRVVLTNGAEAHGVTRLQTIYKTGQDGQAQYPEGITMASGLVGNVPIFRGAGDVLTPVSLTGGLPIQAPGASGIPAVGAPFVIGAVDNASGNVTALYADSNGSLNVRSSVVSPVVVAAPLTPTSSTVSDTITSTLALETNFARIEAEFTNTSSAECYLLKGSGTASATDFTVRLVQYGYYSSSYLGDYQVVWASDPDDGELIITESVGI